MKWIKRSLLALAAVLMSGLCQADGIEGDTYTRTKGNGSWGTLCLSRAITNVEGATLWIPYWCAKDEGSSFISPLYIREIEALEFPIAAGTPVMFNYTSNQLIVTLSGESVTEAVAKNHMVGNLSAETALEVPTASSDFILAWTWKNSKDHSQGGADEIREVTSGTVTIPQYRAYLDLSDLPTSLEDAQKKNQSSGARENVLGWTLGGGVIDEPTGIVTIDEHVESTLPVMYDLNGHRANWANRGIVISNGHKVIKK